MPAKRTPAKPPAKRAPAKRAPRKTAAKAKTPAINLADHGARVVSIFGPFAAKTLIIMPTDRAAELFEEPLEQYRAHAVTEGVARNLAEIAKRDKALAEGALAESALALALQLDHPGNSATSKAMCAKALAEAVDRLFELAPPERKADGVDQLRARRAAKQQQRARRTAT
jgi:hypothetical protein